MYGMGKTAEYLKKLSSGWILAGIGAIAGIILGFLMVGGYHLAGSSYFCGSCHSMDYVYSKWHASKHKQFSCVECHMPAGNIATKLTYKATAGLNDLFHETIRDYPAALTISPKGKHIANDNCLRCHFSTVENTSMAKGGANCIKCHHGLVHGRGIEKGGLTIE